MKSIWLFAVYILIAIQMSGCSSHAYFNEAMQYMTETRKVLVEQGVCSGEADCTQKGIAFWEAGGWSVGPFNGGGVSISVYKIADPKIANKIIERCKALHTRMPTVLVTVTIFSNAHIDNLHPGTPNVVARERIS